VRFARTREPFYVVPDAPISGIIGFSWRAREGLTPGPQLITLRNNFSPTHKRTEGPAPVWGFELTTEVAHCRVDSEEIAARLAKTKFRAYAWLRGS